MLDALIAGGGPAGAATAIALARSGRRVLLVDAMSTESQRLRVGESLPPAARPLLRDLGLLDRLESAGHLRSYGTSSAWGSPRPTATNFTFDPAGPGWHLERQYFDRSLRQAAAEAGAEVRDGAVSGARRTDGGWRVDLGGDGETTARTLVDATGRRAGLARTLGARRHRHDRLIGIVAAAPAREADLDAGTLIEAVPNGWWYTALIPGRSRVFALMTDSDLVPPRARTSAGFQAALGATEHLAPLLAASLASPQTEPAHSSLLDPPTGKGWIAVGDAALAFDPISSQGILTALYTGMIGAETLIAHLDGDPTATSAYAARLNAIAAAYWQNRARAYSDERRWPLHPFWTRRQGFQPPVG